MTRFDEIQALDAEHVMQTYGRLAGRVRARRGHEALGQRGQGVPRLPRRARGHVARPRAPGGRRRDRRPGRARCCTCRTSTTTTCSRGSPRASTALLGGGGPGVLRQLRRRGQRVRDQARPPLRPGQRRPRALPRALGVRLVPRPHAHHARRDRPAAEAGDVPAAARRASARSRSRDLDALAAAMDERVCAVMLEAVQGEGGVQPAPAGYLEAVRALCDEREALLIIDEVQTGLGRTGQWFGFEHADGVRPDVVTMAKALGNGVPIGACWARADVAAAFRPGDHATTFGGQPLAARAALAVLDVMEREDVPARAARAGRAAHQGAARRCPASPTSAGAGLLLAAELDAGHRRRAGRAACLDAGLVVNAVTPTALRFAPSLLVTDDEIDAAVAILDEVLAGGRGMSRVDFLEVDDLDAGRVRRGARRRRARGRRDPAAIPQRARRARASRCCSRSRRPAPACRPRWRSSALGGHPIYIRPEEVGLGVRESVDDVARTLAGLLRGDRGAGVRPRHARGDGRGRSTSRSSTCSRTARTRARRWPTSSRCASCSATSKAAGSSTSATATTSPRRSRSAPRSRASSSRSRRRRATSSTTTTVERARNLGGDDRARRRSVRSGRGRRRGLHRRVDVDGPGGRGRGAARRVRRLPGRRRR